MGNVHMEATQINYRGGASKMNVEDAIKSAIELTPEQKTNINKIPTIEAAVATKTDQAVIAPEFDAESGIYAIGDLVMHEGKLYEFTTAHETAGDWNLEEVTEKTVADEVDSLKSGLNNSWSLGWGSQIANNTDLNNITTVGNYYAVSPTAATLSHCPTTGAFKLKVLYDVRESAPTYIEQVFNPMSSYDEYRRYKSGDAEWSDWHLTNCNLDEIKSGLTTDDILFSGSISDSEQTNYAFASGKMASDYVFLSIALTWYNGVYSDNVVVIPASEWPTNESIKIHRHNDDTDVSYLTITSRDSTGFSAQATTGVSVRIRGIIKK